MGGGGPGKGDKLPPEAKNPGKTPGGHGKDPHAPAAAPAPGPGTAYTPPNPPINWPGKPEVLPDAGPGTPYVTIPRSGELAPPKEPEFDMSPFADMLASMQSGFASQQAAAQSSMNKLMETWAAMAQPKPAGEGTTPVNPYADGAGSGQVSAVYNPMGQNGLNFGWNAGANPFSATF